VAVPDTAQGKPSPRVPTTGKRGGLGRTLLTAFLILAIGPLSLLAGFSAYLVRNDQQQRVLDRLAVVADLTGAQLQDWAERQALKLTSLANTLELVKLVEWLEANPSASKVPENQLDITQAYYQDFESIWIHDTRTGHVWQITNSDSDWQLDEITLSIPAFSPSTQLIAGSDGIARFLFIVSISELGESYLQLTGIAQVPEHFFTSRLLSGVVGSGYLYFASPSGQFFSLDGLPISVLEPPPGISAGSLRLNVGDKVGQDWQGLYINHVGVPVVGVYHWLQDLNCALIAEQDQANALAASDRFAAGLIAAILAVALLTAVIAAVVTRQVTRPIVRLTEVALRMAEGDLSQRVQTDRRDEIGILAHVFNKMTTDLSELYAGLEKKVVERTRELQEAKEQIQYHAWQQSISAEVGRITTSILDLDTLLEQASQLIRDAFQLDHVAIYLLNSSGEIAILRQNTGRAVRAHERQLRVGGTHPVSWVIAQRVLRVVTRPGEPNMPGQYQRLVLPLALGTKVVGALDLTSFDQAGFSESDQSVLQALADQLTVAIENARTYGQEHTTIDEMREADRLRGQFLTRMSHQLATYLNTIIGFSKVMLKGIDGPLTELQVKDLLAIQHSGQQLLQLHNDILDLANLEVGSIEMHFVPVDLNGLIDELRAALRSVLINPQLSLEIRAEPDLPVIMADAERLRQVLINLVVTAAEISSEGIIELHVEQHIDEQTQFLISAPVIWDGMEGDHGINLALSRRLVELHNGRLRVEQRPGSTVFSFTLPFDARTTKETENRWQETSGNWDLKNV